MEYDLTGNEQRVLSIYPTQKGFSFTYFESGVLIDWGNVCASQANFKIKVDKVINNFNPEVLVTQKDDNKVRGERVALCIEEILSLCKYHNIFVKQYSRLTIKGVFSTFESFNKYEISQKIITWFPELFHIQPPKRKIWKPESGRMGIFDSISLAIVYFRIDG